MRGPRPTHLIIRHHRGLLVCVAALSGKKGRIVVTNVHIPWRRHISSPAPALRTRESRNIAVNQRGDHMSRSPATPSRPRPKRRAPHCSTRSSSPRPDAPTGTRRWHTPPPCARRIFGEGHQATAEHNTVGPKVSSALMLATATTVGNDYVVAITSRLAGMLGWADDEVAALRSGNHLGDNTIDASTISSVGRRQRRRRRGTHLEDRAGRRLDRSAAGRGVRVPGPDRLHRILPELRPTEIDV